MSKQTNFIILIGGPGTFEPCDREHDQTWSNYITPIQVATQEKQLEQTKGEQIQWWVYAPAYRERWSDDVADVKDPKIDRGRNLLDSRQTSIDKVKASGARDYLDRIKRFASTVNAQFKAIESPAAFWAELGSVPNGSVSRLWYIGHASESGLMLKLIHAEVNGVACQPAAAATDMINIGDISKNSGLIAQKLSKKGKPSKFYGCHTKAFAEQWSRVFKVTAEGALRKIDFGLVDQPSSIKKVLPRLEDKADWKTFPSP